MASESYYSWYSHSLATWIAKTIVSGNTQDIAAISGLWDDEPWESIVEKTQTEGSIWYVWWADGVRAYMQLDAE